jgi:glyoxylase-like metal-dependent hydrolase (beta-lactamase superfamily II)
MAKKRIGGLMLAAGLIGASLVSSDLRAEVSLTVFDCGHLAVANVAPFGISNEETTVRELFVPCYLVKHDEHLMIWDAGLPLTSVGSNDGTTRYEVSIIDQLAALSIAPSDIDFVAFSHMHYDHVGAANAFSEATLLIQDSEATAAFDHPEDNVAFQAPLYSNLPNLTRVTLNGDHDVFGDGSVQIISAPGHTPGHQVLYLELENFGPLVLSGDLYHFEVSRELRRAPVFNSDIPQTLKSMDKVEALVRDTGAAFWIEHNQELAETLNLAPAFYD